MTALSSKKDTPTISGEGNKASVPVVVAIKERGPNRNRAKAATAFAEGL
jgi:hypothetical protein